MNNHTTSNTDDYANRNRNMAADLLSSLDAPRDDDSSLRFARLDDQLLQRSTALGGGGLGHQGLHEIAPDRNSLAFRLEFQKQELQREIQLAELRYRQLREETLLRQRAGMHAGSLPRDIDRPREARDLLDPPLTLSQRYDSSGLSGLNRETEQDRLLLLARRNAALGSRGSWMKSAFPERNITSDRRATNYTEPALLLERLQRENDMHTLLLEERLQRSGASPARLRDDALEQGTASLPQRPAKQARKAKGKESRKARGKSDRELGRMKKKMPVALEGERPIAGAVTFPLASANDKDFVSPYQALVRQSLEFFQTSPGDVFSNIHGRNNEIRLGQIGVRCKFCAHRPVHWRGRGCLYFPSRVSGVYQAAQNVANNHLANSCPDLPEDMKEQLDQLRGRSSAKRGGGKKYWEDTCRSLGLCEREGEPGVWLR